MTTIPEASARVRASMSRLLDEIADRAGHTESPRCCRTASGCGYNDCKECQAIDGCLRRLASLPEPAGNAFKLYVNRAVEKAMAEALDERGFDTGILATV